MTTLLTAGFGSVDCLEFLYNVRGSNATLSVVLRPLSGSHLQLWSITSYGTVSNKSWTSATIPFQSPEAFKINFESHSTDPQAIIAVDAVTYMRDFPGCKFLPESVAPDYHLVTKPRPIFTTTPPGPATKSSNGDDNSQNNTAVIAGSVVAVVVVVVLIIIGVVIWRKRKSDRGKTNKEQSKHTEHTRDDNRQSEEGEMAGGVSAEAQYDHVGERSPPSDYSSLQMNASTSESTPSYYNVRRDTDLYLSPVSYSTTGKGLYENVGK
ncbi:hypothetical protein BaRGS_00029182 [Batillaria attramentaria]|uniref:MAM domain-containing protein n=1 Tax=Batillaria attramentaria TaxID=370345 RepID=A0ABD0JYA1_9CAEN